MVEAMTRSLCPSSLWWCVLPPSLAIGCMRWRSLWIRNTSIHFTTLALPQNATGRLLVIMIITIMVIMIIAIVIIITTTIIAIVIIMTYCYCSQYNDLDRFLLLIFRLRQFFSEHNLVVASYDIVRNDIDFFSLIKWNYVILDEGHVIKNSKTKVYDLPYIFHVAVYISGFTYSYSLPFIGVPFIWGGL